MNSRHRTYRLPGFDRTEVVGSEKPRKKGTAFTGDDQLQILFGKANGRSNRRIARAISASKAGVREYWKRTLNDPASIFDLRVLAQIEEGVYLCELCLSECQGWREGVRHLLCHFLPADQAMKIPMRLIPKPL